MGRMMGNWDYPKEPKAKLFLQTLWHGLKAIGEGMLAVAMMFACSMGVVIACKDIIGKWTFEWWHLAYWIIEILGCAYLIGNNN